MVATQESSKAAHSSLSEQQKEQVKRAVSKIPYTAKYRKSLEFATTLRMGELLKVNKALPLPHLISELVKGFPAETPSGLLVSMVEFIIKEWENRNK